MSAFKLDDRVHDGFNAGTIVQIDDTRTPPLYLIEVQLWPGERPVQTWRASTEFVREEDYWRAFKARVGINEAGSAGRT